VIGTGSTKSHDLLRELGADETIDYTTQEFESIVRDVDVVLDTIGGETQERSWQMLKEGGSWPHLSNRGRMTKRKHCAFVAR
jgi:NADPH:quinone reductase-like Zn-dependent oxidoreductase